MCTLNRECQNTWDFNKIFFKVKESTALIKLMIHIIKWFVRFWNIFMIKFWSIETVLFDLQNLQRGLFLCWLNICNVCYCNSLIEQSNILFIIMFIYIFCHPTFSSFRPGSPTPVTKLWEKLWKPGPPPD